MVQLPLIAFFRGSIEGKAILWRLESLLAFQEAARFNIEGAPCTRGSGKLRLLLWLGLE